MSAAATSAALNGQSYHRMPHSVENKTLGIVRRSTPDSEAVLSSDDDHEPNPAMSMSLHSAKSMPAQPPIRRASWLSEVRTAQRKYSLGGQSLGSVGGTSQPPTPSAENGHTPRPLSSTGRSDRQSHTSISSLNERPSFPHHASGAATSPSAIWESGSGRPGPVGNPWVSQTPSNLWPKTDYSRWPESQTTSTTSLPHHQPSLEELVSPTSHYPPEPIHTDTSHVGIPFDIPLEPNRKAIRSQSYSAGQVDFRQHLYQDKSYPQRYPQSRNQLPSLPRRKSKAIMDEHNNLSAVEEDVGDVDAASSYSGGTGLPPGWHPARSVASDDRLNEPMSPNSSVPGWGSMAGLAPGGGVRLDIPYSPPHARGRQDSVPAGLGYGQQDSASSATAYGHQDSNLSAMGYGQQANAPPQDEISNLGRSLSQLEFDTEFQKQQQIQMNIYRERRGLRHIKDTIDPYAYNDQDKKADESETKKIEAAAKSARDLVDAMNYMHRSVQPQGAGQAVPVINHIINNSEQQPYMGADPMNQMNIPGFTDLRDLNLDAIPVTLDIARREAAKRTGQPETMPLPPPGKVKYFGGLNHRGDASGVDALKSLKNDRNPRTKDLYLVTFKSNRADVFYLAAGVDPEPVPGDMVIVEADRGNDLGMVQFKGLMYEEAAIRKQEYNRHHYNTLVRFSRVFPHIAQASQGDPILNEFAGFNKGDQTAFRREVNPRPGMLRRIATDREIRLLRDKEGNEAKAKRICQAKVNHRGLYLEILDAEFQYDYRKLTFYFYAEKYINFNEIVCDLFKIWKTRIWMASVNPENYVAPPGAKEFREERRLKREKEFLNHALIQGDQMGINEHARRIRGHGLDRGSLDSEGNPRYSLKELMEMARSNGVEFESPEQIQSIAYGKSTVGRNASPLMRHNGSHMMDLTTGGMVNPASSPPMPHQFTSPFQNQLYSPPNMGIENSYNTMPFQQMGYGGQPMHNQNPFSNQGSYGAPSAPHNQSFGATDPSYLMWNGMQLDPSMPNANAQLVSGQPSTIRQQYQTNRQTAAPNPPMPSQFNPNMSWGQHMASPPLQDARLAQNVTSRGELPPEFVPSSSHNEEPKRLSLKEQVLAQMKAKSSEEAPKEKDPKDEAKPSQ